MLEWGADANLVLAGQAKFCGCEYVMVLLVLRKR